MPLLSLIPGRKPPNLVICKKNQYYRQTSKIRCSSARRSSFFARKKIWLEEWRLTSIMCFSLLKAFAAKTPLRDLKVDNFMEKNANCLFNKKPRILRNRLKLILYVSLSARCVVKKLIGKATEEKVWYCCSISYFLHIENTKNGRFL